MRGTSCKESASVCPLRSLRCASCVCATALSRVQLFATPRTVARQTSLSMGFSRQVYWSGLPHPPPGDLPYPGIEPEFFLSQALAGGFFTSGSTGEDRTDLFSCFWILFFRVSFCGFLNFFLTDSFPHLSWLFHMWVPSAILLFIVSSLWVSHEVGAEVWSLKKMLRRTGLWLSEAKHSIFISQ